jgi:Baseplate J-like protein
VSCTCGCCAGIVPGISLEVENRPSLSAVAYRLGTFASFRQALLDEIAGTPELAALSTRASDDPTITAMELWAAVADVLTFYQERYGNEGFLRTATLRESVLRMVRLLDYQLRPGVAATTQLAFTLEPGTTVSIPVGLRVQSVPSDGEKPQKFETTGTVLADARFNRRRIVPAPEPAAPLAAGSLESVLTPGQAGLDLVEGLAAGNQVILFRSNALEIQTVAARRTEDDLLSIVWSAPLAADYSAAADGDSPTAGVWKLGRTIRLFGHDAAPVSVVSRLGTVGDPTTAYLSSEATDFSLTGDGSNGTSQLFLDGRYESLKPGVRLLVVLSTGGAVSVTPVTVISAASGLAVRRSIGVPATTVVSATVTQLGLSGTPLGAIGIGDVRNVTIFELLGSPLAFWKYRYPETLSDPLLYLPGRRAGWETVEVGRTIEKNKLIPGVAIGVNELDVGRQLLLTDGRGGAPVPATVTGSALIGSDLRLSATPTDKATLNAIGFAPESVERATALVSGPLPATVTLPNSRRELLVTIGTLPPQTVTLGSALASPAPLAALAAAVESAVQAAIPGAPTFARARVLATASELVLVAGINVDPLAVAPTPADGDTIVALGLDAERVRYLDGILSKPISGFPGGVSGNVTAEIGLDAPLNVAVGLAAGTGPTDLSVLLNGATGGPGFAQADGRVLAFPPIPRREVRQYLRISVTSEAPYALESRTALFFGNVAPASHGETVKNEIVGNGDGAKPFQRFTLTKKPVTYLSGAGGATSTLQLLVNGVEWTEVPTLYGRGESETVFIARVGDDATLSIRSGDGNHAARFPSGRSNLVATYRTGTGLAGRVAANKLTTLLDRPTGLKSVNNPTAADGGADPESLDQARESAPGTVRTFGRAVSLRDFEDIALATGEVAKASADWTWTGERRAIHLTIAAQRGGLFSKEGLKRIRATIDSQRDPNHLLLVDNYIPVAIIVTASLSIASDRVNADVVSAARAALLASLAFDAMGFAQPVHLSDLYAVLQGVEGVVSVDIDDLNFKSADPAFRTAHGATTAQPQPYLRVLPAKPQGGPGSPVLPAELAVVEIPSQDVVLRGSGGLA